MQRNSSFLFYLLTTIALLVGNALTAQEATVVLERIEAHYEQKSDLCYVMQMEYYENLTAQQPDRTAEMAVAQNNRQYYNKINSGEELLEQFITNELVLEVDHRLKTVRYRQPQPGTLPEQPSGIQSILEMASVEGMQLEKIQEKGLPGLRLSAPQTAGTVLEIFYDENYQVLETRMKVEVDKTRYQGNLNGKKMICQFTYCDDRKTHQLSDFLRLSGKEYVLAPSLKAYTLIP